MNIIERVFCVDMHDSNEFNMYSGPAIVQSAMRINNCFEMYIRFVRHQQVDSFKDRIPGRYYVYPV